MKLAYINTNKLHFTLIIFLLTTIFSFSQENKKTINVLKRIIRHEDNSLEKAKALVKLSDILYNTNVDTVLILCEQSLLLLKKIPSDKLKTKDVFIYNQTKALAFNNIGAVFYQSGNYSKAISYFLQATKIREKIKDNAGLSESYNNIAYIYKQQEDSAKAIQYYKKSLNFAKKNNDLQAMSKAFNGLASASDINSTKTTLEYYFKSLKIEQQLGNEYEVGKREQNIGAVYQNNNEYALASRWYLKSIKTKKLLNDFKGLSTTLISLANLKIEEENYAQAEKYAKEAYLISKENDYTNNIILSCGQLYDIHLKNKNYKEALEMFVEQTENKEQTLIEANETETVKLQLQYDFDKKLAEDSLSSSNEKEKLNIKIKLQQEKQLGLYLFILVSLVFLLLTFNRFRKTKKQKVIIENKNIEVIKKNKEITDSIKYAKKIQYALLANKELLSKNLKEHFIIFKPKDIVSGDFYWAFRKNNYFYLAVCDSTGHGVPGAFMSLLNISFLNEAINEKNLILPNEILNHVRNRLISNISQEGSQDGMDATLICINSDTSEITYSAAYNAPILISNNKIEVLNVNRMPIGKSPKEHESFTLHTINAQKGDMLYLHTDGYVDQFGGPKGKKFKIKSLLEKLLLINKDNLENQAKELELVFEEWKGNLEQVDDTLVIGIKI